ncbi:NAD-dependent isocitrate dehydrogenase [Oscillochloris sp. ZM17-4]|uniref:isocitrate/isopropylmalate dehydrogenase family protein n=1 Tax=Oscillochloris sp. ZM17-4 TaxID=2866714 RepID=UPI001C735471|nr:isocitrate/isopropylmalate family dehydrogenase [Oscillochloris sp. ZM17-4]MBX0328629.1 NAD-dependent isocitrate dehydrogenase [Oscillochloris sp. ZM17-4]
MRVCVIPGDGIGPEVLGAAVDVLRAVAPDVELAEAEAGWAAFQRHGEALPAATLAAARAADAVLFGAVASPSHSVPGYRSPIVSLRRELDLYANIRPVVGLQIADCRLQIEAPIYNLQSAICNLVVVRENTEGLYAGRERLEDGGDTAIAERLITRRASARIVRAAFDLARSRAAAGKAHPKVTIVHKANVLRVSDGLFRTVALEVAAQHPDIAHEEMLVDVAAMRVAQTPGRFDVIVTTNLFGDILSDVACIHGGGLGLASSANLGEGRALFEPVHGAAPDIAGQGIANPLAAIECAAMLLEWRRRAEAAARVRAAAAAVMSDGPRTPDLGGASTTAEVARAVIERL